MPDRIIRDELLESQRWLSLKDNADRLAFLALLLRSDSLGNFSGDPFRLMRLWRDFGINTPELVAKTMIELADHDLIRPYEVDGAKLIHIPRFGQRNLRYIKRLFPLSPWTTEEQKQRLDDNSQRGSTAHAMRSRAEIREDKIKREVEVESPTRSTEKVKTVFKEGLNPKNMTTREIAEAVASGRIGVEKVKG